MLPSLPLLLCVSLRSQSGSRLVKLIVFALVLTISRPSLDGNRSLYRSLAPRLAIA